MVLSKAETQDNLGLRSQAALAAFGDFTLAADLDEVLTEACRLTAVTLSTGLARVVQPREDGSLLVRAGQGWATGSLGMIIEAGPDFPAIHALRAAPIVSDRETETRFGYPPHLADHGVVAFASVPIPGGRGQPPFGILEADSRAPRRFTEDDVAFLRNCANLVAAAIARLRVAEGAEALREAQGLNTLILNSNRDCIVVLDLEGRTQYVSAGGIEGLEISDVSAVLGLSWLQDWDDDDREAARAALAEARAGRAGRFEGFCPTHRGMPKWWDVVVSPLPGPDGKVERLVSVGRDITGRKFAEARLRRLNQTLEQQVVQRTADLAALSRRAIEEIAEREQAQAEIVELYNRSPIPLHSVDKNIRLLSVSDRWLQFMGYDDRDEVLGRKVEDFLTEESARRQREEVWPMVLRSGEFFEVEYQFVRKTGEILDVLIAVVVERNSDGSLRRTISGLIDISARKRAEEQLRQAQKMEAVGQLTGGIAHDFNNLLTSITGSLELMQAQLAKGSIGGLERYIVIAEGAAKRAAALTHRLLAFSRRQTLDPKPVDANRLVLGMDEMIRRTVGPTIAVETVLADGLWPVFGDPNQLENALLNLSINARDAMPDGGRLTIQSGNMRLDEGAARARDMEPGQYVTLCVTDIGTGMAPEVMARAFDPFFTTKPLGQGTGLGLSMIYGFAHQSGGQVRICSELGTGTTVRLYLPRHRGEMVDEALTAGADEEPRAALGKTVLVVDDEPTVRMLVAEVLTDFGYETIEAEDGAEGLQALQAHGGIDLLVTDVGLPGGMNGRQLADFARQFRPEIKVLFITGYAEAAVIDKGHLEPGMHVLTKPFALKTLATRIRDILLTS